MKNMLSVLTIIGIILLFLGLWWSSWRLYFDFKERKCFIPKENDNKIEIRTIYCFGENWGQLIIKGFPNEKEANDFMKKYYEVYILPKIGDKKH